MARSNLLGKTVLGYTVEEVLGSGSFGTVYRVTKTNPSGKFVRALKHITVPSREQYMQVLNSMGGDVQKADDYFSETLKSFISEIKILNELTDLEAPNIVRYFENDIRETNNPKSYNIFILMEYLTPLDKYMFNNKFTVRDVGKLGLDVLKGLSSCHDNNIIHRDIKIENIFVGNNGNYKIGDFGVSKVLLEQSRASSMIGTPNFLAPEVYAGTSSYSNSVDLYSLGITLYRLLNHNRNPFLPPYPEQYYASDEQEAFDKRMNGEIPGLPAFGGEKIGKVVVKALSSAEDRYKTADEFLKDLEKALNETDDKELDVPVSLVETQKGFSSTTVYDDAGETILDLSTLQPEDNFVAVEEMGTETLPQDEPRPGNRDYTETLDESVISNMNRSRSQAAGNDDLNRQVFENMGNETQRESTTPNYSRTSTGPPPGMQPNVTTQKGTSNITFMLIGILVAILLIGVAFIGFSLVNISGTGDSPPVIASDSESDGSDPGGYESSETTDSGSETIVVPPVVEVKESESESETPPTKTITTGEYILPDSNSRYLTEADLEGLSKEQLRLARNEISARHGRRYDIDWIQEYFNGKSWYNPQYDPTEFDSMAESILTDVEKSNMYMIQDYEHSKGYYY